ncbi:MAG: hypothetical protein AABZ31_02430 [Bdellovibrionota bacterium]
MSLIEQLSLRYKTPEQVQKFLRRLKYNREEKGETLRSAEQALKKQTAHCLEATFVAAAILEKNGYPPLVVSFESQDGLDHVIYVFQRRRRWGSVARSRDDGLHGRPPIYRSLRDLVWSYFEPYIDKTGRITGFQLAHLDDSQANWRKSLKNVWKAEQYLIDLKHRPLKSSNKRYQKAYKSYLKRGPMPAKSYWW